MAYDFDTVYDRTATESSKWHTYPPDVLPMPVADMDFESPEPVIRALRERVEHGFFGYGGDRPEFKEVAAARLARRYGWMVEPESIVLFPGVINSFNLAVKTFTTPGDGVLVHAPTYGPILNCPANHGAVRQDAALSQAADGRYEVDRQAFESAMTDRTRIFLLCNPHNPTGRVFTRPELGEMAEMCLRRDLLIVSDEIHCDLVHGERRHTPIAALSPEIEARTLTFMAPSKTFNLPGLKCSIAVITDKDLRERFQSARAGLISSVNILGYTASLAAYRDGDDWLQALLLYLEGNRDFLANYVRKHLPGIVVAPPEGTYLAWLDCRSLRIPNGDPYRFFLDEAKVGLSDGTHFGELGKGFVRLNFGCPRSLLVEGLDRMRRAVERL